MSILAVYVNRERGVIEGYLVTPLKKYEIVTGVMTARQEHILQIALEKGYFEFPKKISLRELAKTIEVSPATLSEILRSGQKRVLQEHFKDRPSVLTRQRRLAWGQSRGPT